MKRIIIIRSFRVALVLGILCGVINLMMLKSGWYCLLLLPTILFLDASDSMLVWRLKRITSSYLRSSLISAYLIVVLIAVCLCIHMWVNKHAMMRENPYLMTFVLYPGLISLFSFRYFVIVVRVMARYMDRD
jgi:hypothetical protein